MIRSIVASGIVMTATAGSSLVEDHAIDLKTVGAVGAIVLSGTWSLSKRFARIEEKLEGLKELQHRIEVVEKLILYASRIPDKHQTTALDKK